MKHPTAQEVCGVAEAVGVVLTESQAELIAAHARWLLDATRRVNLTSITEAEGVLRLHVADSLAALSELTEAPAGKAIDIGTGGGYPGFPLSVANSRQMVLLDSVEKKSTALGLFLAGSGWTSASAVCGRAEDHAREQAGAYSAVVVRAVAELPSLVELASPLLAQGGRLIALKGRPQEEELTRAVAVGKLTGMRKVSERGLRLPGQGETRCVVVFERVGKSQLALPRGTGRAQKKPLA